MADSNLTDEQRNRFVLDAMNRAKDHLIEALMLVIDGTPDIAAHDLVQLAAELCSPMVTSAAVMAFCRAQDQRHRSKG